MRNKDMGMKRRRCSVKRCLRESDCLHMRNEGRAEAPVSHKGSQVDGGAVH